MERLFEAFVKVTMDSTLIAPRGAAMFCLVVSALYIVGVYRTQRLYDDAELDYSIYPSLSNGTYAAHSDLFENRARTFREYMLRVSTLCLWLAGAMSMFAVQAYVEALRFDPVEYNNMYSNWTESGMRATWPSINATPDDLAPGMSDYLNVLYLFMCLAIILVLAWLLIPAAFTKSDFSLRERTTIWLYELAGRDTSALLADKVVQETPSWR